MKISKLWLFPIAMMVIVLAIGYAPPGYAAPHTENIPLKDANGNNLAVGNTVPYSPKKTCATTDCHTNVALYGASTGTALYENTTAYATKNNGTGQPTYQVPYPKHGVTAGYHFQQGRNLDWGDAQRENFHQADFTSSGGMYGKY
jgi:hypothetical protein